MKNAKSQLPSLVNPHKSISTHPLINTAVLVGALLGSGMTYAQEKNDGRYTGSWSNYGITWTAWSGVGTKAILSSSEDIWGIWYRGEEMKNGGNNTVIGAFPLWENWMFVPAHARTTAKTSDWTVIEQNSHIEMHHIDEWKKIDHAAISLGYGKTTGNGKENKEFVWEKWTSLAVSAGWNLNIGNQHGYIYGTIGQEYISKPHDESINFWAIEYHSGKFRASLFATKNKLREYKAEYGNGAGFMIWVSHTEGLVTETRGWIWYTLSFGWKDAGHGNHLGSAALIEQWLFATDITNPSNLAAKKWEFEEDENHSDHPQKESH